MIGFLFLAAVAPLFVAATPSPAPSAVLPEIGRVRSNTLCTTLRQNIAPTVLGLMKNDDIIGAGHRAFSKMVHDQAGTSSAAMDIDMLYLEQVQTRLVHNLKAVDTLLGDEKRFPSVPKNDDDRDALMMRSQLEAVADSQRKALDLVSSALDTEALGQMQHDISDQMKGATSQNGPGPNTTPEPVSFIGAAGLPEYTPASGVPTTQSKLSTVEGHSAYDAVVQALEVTQSTIAHREQTATSSVVTAVAECRASSEPQPSPLPSP